MKHDSNNNMLYFFPLSSVGYALSHFFWRLVTVSECIVIDISVHYTIAVCLLKYRSERRKEKQVQEQYLNISRKKKERLNYLILGAIADIHVFDQATV